MRQPRGMGRYEINMARFSIGDLVRFRGAPAKAREVLGNTSLIAQCPSLAEYVLGEVARDRAVLAEGKEPHIFRLSQLAAVTAVAATPYVGAEITTQYVMRNAHAMPVYREYLRFGRFVTTYQYAVGTEESRIPGQVLGAVEVVAFDAIDVAQRGIALHRTSQVNEGAGRGVHDELQYFAAQNGKQDGVAT